MNDAPFVVIPVVCDKSGAHRARKPFTLGSFRYAWSEEDRKRAIPEELLLGGWWWVPRWSPDPLAGDGVTELVGDVPMDPVDALRDWSGHRKGAAPTRATIHIACGECGKRGAVDLRGETLVPILNELRDAGVPGVTLSQLNTIVQNKAAL